MNHVPLARQTAPTWRDALAGSSERPRPLNRTGRHRVVVDGIRLWLSVVAVGVSLVFGYTVWGVWKTNPAALAAPVQSSPLREIAVRTDGVLNRSWVERTLGIAPGTGLMSLDLIVLRDRLLDTGQVRTAVVTRRFPDVLGVILEERSPVLRVRAQAEDGEQRHLFVARDGSVFVGEQYSEPLVASLPWLAGVTLSRNLSGPGFARLDGMEAVSELLGTTRASVPSLARDFQIVSLARFARDDVILVRTPEVSEIAFAARDDFYRQIARLDYILDQHRARPDAAPLRSINLAVGGRQVPVSFDPPAASGVTPVAKPAPRAAVPIRSFFHL